MPKPVLSFKLLACCWGGVALLAGSGAVALQLTDPGPAPMIVAVPAFAAATPALGVTTPAAAATLPFTATPAVTATPLPATTPMPFRNSSLLALLTPPADHPAERAPERMPERVAEHAARPAVHAAVAPSLPLPLPPIPPAQHVARVEPRRPAPVYAAEPQPAYPDWGRPMPYPGQFASVRQYQYGAPPAYYGWQPYY